jgi:hypothetical protein
VCHGQERVVIHYVPFTHGFCFSWLADASVVQLAGQNSSIVQVERVPNMNGR